MNASAKPLVVMHTCGGYDFRIAAGAFTRRIGNFMFFARVTRARRHGNPAELIALRQLPFIPLEHWGMSQADAVAKAIAQIDDWFMAHPNADKNCRALTSPWRREIVSPP